MRHPQIVSFRDVKASFGNPPLHACPDDDAPILVVDGRLESSRIRLDHGSIEQSLGLSPGPQAAQGVVARELVLSEEIYNGEGDFGPFLWVLGSCRARRLDVGGSEVHFGGDVEITQSVLAVYNHGTLTFAGSLKAESIVSLDHAIQLQGAVQAELGIGGWQVVIHRASAVEVPRWIGLPWGPDGKPCGIGSKNRADYRMIRPDVFDWRGWASLTDEEREERADDITSHVHLDDVKVSRVLAQSESLLRGDEPWVPPRKTSSSR